MTPLILFLLGCLTVYVGAIQAAFSALMRLPLRLNAERAERHGRPDCLGHYLEDPVRLFVPARLLQALTVAVATMLVMVETSARSPAALGVVFGGVVAFVVACGHAVPLLVVRRDPERVLELLLPSFDAIARGISPVTRPLVGLLDGVRRDRVVDTSVTDGGGVAGADGDGADPRSAVDEHEERRLLKSVVEFGDTLVREVMTPRPDIVATKSTATLGDLRAVFADQQYSRIPVYKENLDEILGFVFVKDLVALHGIAPDGQVIERLRRPAYVVPETKRVAELLKEFQRQQVQSAIVHDEYGGTAGLVTIEDLLEEIVGEIRDEYDVESEPIVDEGDGSFVFAGTVGVDDAAERLQIDIERQGFETVGGYLLARLGRVPRVGEHLNVDDVQVEILEGERRRVQRVRMRRQSAGGRIPSVMRSGFVSLIGRPNAGKSTLLNRLVGTKLAIVSDKPQTTRNQILAVKNLDGDVAGQIVLVDTPGIHRPLHRMNVRMVDLALDTLGKVDVLVVVLDASTKTGAGDRYLLTLLERVKVPVILALNKIDLIAKNRLLPLIDWYRQQRDFVAIVPVSALTGDGQGELERAIVELMPEGEPLYPTDYLTDQPERVLAAETVREKVLTHTRAELPFSTAVVVDRFEEPDRDGDGILRIYCSILVERETQKRIVIGRGGTLIKKIGTEARQDLEAFFASRVYLDLHVRVRAGWRDDERILSELGITKRS